MRPFALVLGPQERAVLAELVTRAAASPIGYATMKKIADAHASGVKGLGTLNRAPTVEIPRGYTVALTHEEHKPGVMCRHVSIGLRTKAGRGPSPEAVRELLPLVGFVNSLGGCAAWLERLEDGTICPNFVEPLSGDMQEIAR